MVSTATALNAFSFPLESFRPTKGSSDPDTPTFAPAPAIVRQTTMEYLGQLLKGYDTPDEPLPQLFDGQLAAGPYPTQDARPQTPAELDMSKLFANPSFDRVGEVFGRQPSMDLKRPAENVLPAAPLPKRTRRHEAPEPQPEPSTSAPSAPPSAPAKKAKNPKRADRRRTIARFTTAILRAGGSNAFIARDGLGYRKAFDRFLVDTYGATFAEGEKGEANGYWYEHARVEPFFRVLFYIATEGRVTIEDDVVDKLFCKREKRQAAEWLLDEEALVREIGVSAADLAAIFDGESRVTASGFPRGTPLAVPVDISSFTPTPAAPAAPVAAPAPARVLAAPMPTPAPVAFPPPAPRPPLASGAPSAIAPTAGEMAVRGLFLDPGMGMLAPRRQYSSDLSRLVSDFGRSPSTSEEFLNLMERTNSEIDNMATTGTINNNQLQR